jgi:hypothetical protein
MYQVYKFQNDESAFNYLFPGNISSAIPVISSSVDRKCKIMPDVPESDFKITGIIYSRLGGLS